MRLLFCIGSILIRHDVRLIGAVLADDFFHPDHVVPAPELIAAVVEGTGQREAQMLVELGAVFCEVFVLRLRVADAGVSTLMLDLGQLEQYDKWFAYYNDDLYYPYAYKVWQYSEKGAVDGINEEVDLNIWFGDF